MIAFLEIVWLVQTHKFNKRIVANRASIKGHFLGNKLGYQDVYWALIFR